MSGALDQQRMAEAAGVAVGAIRNVVAAAYGLTPAQIASDRRNTHVVGARQIAMYLAHLRATASFPVIGRQFGDRDRTTVYHAVRRVEALIAQDPAFAARVDKLDRAVRAVPDGLDASAIDADQLAARVAKDPHAVGHLTIAEGMAIAAELAAANELARDRTRRALELRRERDAARRHLARLLAVVGMCLGVMTETGSSLSGREAHQARRRTAMGTLRTAYETLSKETR